LFLAVGNFLEVRGWLFNCIENNAIDKRFIRINFMG